MKTLFAALLVPFAATALNVDPRWGHRTTFLSPQTLLIHGGKTDPRSEYSYTSAKNTGETLLLDLSRSWKTEDVGWTVVGDGPGLAWHTMEHVSGSEEAVLLFGGDGGSDLPIQTHNDSTWLINPSSSSATYHQTDTSQPIRKVFSASCVSTDGKTAYITGGEKADGSGLGYAEAWAVTVSSGVVGYTALPDLPSDLVGHQAVMLRNGTILLIGGWIPSSASFLELSTVYTLDTTNRSARWRAISLSSSATATPRRGHTATLVTDVKGKEVVYVIGGIAGSLQGGQLLSDIWRVDISEGTVELQPTGNGLGKRAVVPGARYDHIAVPVDQQVLVFGGYAEGGPADGGLFVLDTVASEWTTEYHASSSDTVASGSSSSAVSGASSTASGEKGTSATMSRNGDMTGSQRGTSTASATSSVTAKPDSASTGHGSGNRTAIAIGSTLGSLALCVLLLAVWLVRRRRNARRDTLTPFGGRPARRRFGKHGRGERLMQDKLEGPWDAGEKDLAVDGGDEGNGYRNKGYDEGFTNSRPYAPGSKAAASVGLGKASPLVGNIAARIRQVSGRITSGPRQARFRMLEDEDREDLLWKGGSEGSDDIDERRSAEGVSVAEMDDVDSTAPRSGGIDRSEADKELPSPPEPVDPSPVSSYNPFNDPLDNYYDSNIIPDVGNGSLASRAGRPKSSMNSRDSMTESMMADAVQVARRVSVTTAEASYVPLKRKESWLHRVAGSGVGSLFRGTRQSVPQFEDGFLDPTTPPVLDSIREDDSRPSYGFPHALSNFGHSVSSVVSAATANSAFLERYGQMNIVQRDHRPQRSREEPTHATEAELPPVPSRREIRPATPPRGPRPAPLRMPTYIDVGSGTARRPVKDIAASINRRAIQDDVFSSSPLARSEVGRATMVRTESPVGDSSRMRSPVTGPPKAETIYQAVSKAPLVIANNS